MTDKPAESAVERYNALEWVPDGEMGFDPGGREVKAAADAAIEALEAKLAVAEALAAERTEQRNVALSRLAAAEDELERQKQLTVWAQDEVERLRCCGNCEMCAEVGVWCHEAAELGYEGAREAGWPNWYQDGSFNVHVHIGDPCHFTPSRWTERGAE
jgi:hypothetical protein